MISTKTCYRLMIYPQIRLKEFVNDLEQRLGSADIKQVKADVMPFLRNPKEMSIWSNEYFLQLAKMIKFE